MDRRLALKIGVTGIILALDALIIAFLDSLLPEYQIWLGGAVIGISLLIIFVMFRKYIKEVLRILQLNLRNLMPWLIPVNVILCFIILLIVKPTQQTFEIQFDKTRGALFNSWESNLTQPRQIYVYGQHEGDLMWVINPTGAGCFSYQTDTNVTNPDPRASSGGYMTFYDKICDRLIYREVAFKCKATNFDNKTPDVGIRLAVDDPKTAPQDREKVTYELQSLNAYFKGKKKVTNFFQTFTIDLGDFEMIRNEPPFPKGIDINTINKIVFFINSEIVDDCPQATLWFRDIVFVN